MVARMLRSGMNSRLLYAITLPFLPSFSPQDKPLNENLELIPGEIGIDRLKKIFYVNDDGHITKELQSIITSTTTALVGGFIFGGFMRARRVPETFIAENLATQFRSKIDAQRQLQYKFAMSFIKGGTNIAIKLGLFCFLFSSTSTCLYAYRGKFDLLNFCAAGGLTGSLIKMDMGLRGAMAGSIVGATFGTIYGCMTLGILYLTGTKIEDVYEVHANLMNMRRDAISRQAREYMDKDTKALKEIYDKNMEMKEKTEAQTGEKSKA